MWILENYVYTHKTRLLENDSIKQQIDGTDDAINVIEVRVDKKSAEIIC